MNEISDSLKQHESFIDVRLKEIVYNMTEAMVQAPSQLTPMLDEVRAVVFRYDDLAAELCRNWNVALENSTNDFIISDNRIVDDINRDPAYFNDPTKLAEACVIIDTARNIVANFTENTTNIFQEMKLIVMPNELEISLELVGLTIYLTEVTSMEGNLPDFEQFVSAVHELVEKIQKASDLIERNIQPQTVKFGYETDSVAFDVEWKLKKASECFAKLLPDEVRSRIFMWAIHRGVELLI